MDSLRKHYEILGIEPGASAKEIKQAYRDNAKVWHPDRFPNDERLQKKAAEKLKAINEAYECLKGLNFEAQSTATTAEEEEHHQNNVQDKDKNQYKRLFVIADKLYKSGMVICIIFGLTVFLVVLSVVDSDIENVERINRKCSRTRNTKTLINPVGAAVEIPDENVMEALIRGDYRLPENATLPMENAIGEVYSISTKDVKNALDTGWRYEGRQRRCQRRGREETSIYWLRDPLKAREEGRKYMQLSLLGFLPALILYGLKNWLKWLRTDESSEKENA